MRPSKAAATASGVRIGFRCTVCLHEWEIDKQEPQDSREAPVAGDPEIYRAADAALLHAKTLRAALERGLAHAEQIRGSNAEKLTALGEEFVHMQVLADEVRSRRRLAFDAVALAVPMLCAGCGKKEGRPFRVTTVADTGGLRVVLRCAACNHEWEDELDGHHDTLRPAAPE